MTPHAQEEPKGEFEAGGGSSNGSAPPGLAGGLSGGDVPPFGLPEPLDDPLAGVGAGGETDGAPLEGGAFMIVPGAITSPPIGEP